MLTDDIHKSVSRMILDYCKAQYEELCGIWRDLERKAQGTVAISSALLAGLLVYLRFLDSPSLVHVAFILVSLGLLLTSALFSIRALIISEVDCMEDPSTIRKAGDEILSQTDDSEAKAALRSFVSSHAKKWNDISDNLHEVNQGKAGWVQKAQQRLYLAVIATGITIAIGILESVELCA